jgi:hypothetical protein
MMRHPVALYLTATAHTHETRVELFDRSRTRPRRQRFGFVRRFTRPATAGTTAHGEALEPGSSAA